MSSPSAPPTRISLATELPIGASAIVSVSPTQLSCLVHFLEHTLAYLTARSKSEFLRVLPSHSCCVHMNFNSFLSGKHLERFKELSQRSIQSFCIRQEWGSRQPPWNCMLALTIFVQSLRFPSVEIRHLGTNKPGHKQSCISILVACLHSHLPQRCIAILHKHNTPMWPLRAPTSIQHTILLWNLPWMIKKNKRSSHWLTSMFHDNLMYLRFDTRSEVLLACTTPRKHHTKRWFQAHKSLVSHTQKSDF
jgi:hypothetical protein